MRLSPQLQLSPRRHLKHLVELINSLRDSTSRPPKRLTPAVLTLILLALFSCVLSFAKFDHCRDTNWKSPDSYVHACYSDIPVLMMDRGLNTHQWAYSSDVNAVEYPVLTGAVMWATTWITDMDKNSLRNYFDVNIFFISILFIICLLLVWRMRPQFAYLLALSPAVIASLYINWDLWGIVTMLMAIMFFDERRYSLSATMLGISIATKFFPVLLLVPIAVIFWRMALVRTFVRYAATVFAVWLAINLPVIVTTPEGWWRFYSLNLKRGSDWGSIWHALSILGINTDNLNYLSLIALLAVLSAVVLLIMEISYIPTLAEVSFLVMAATLCVGKVYSPQYVLWLAPLAIIAMRNKRTLGAFWIWQAGEAIYHLAIWQHLASLQGSSFGLPATGYALATLLRILSTLVLIVALLRVTLRKTGPQAEVNPKSKAGNFITRP